MIQLTELRTGEPLEIDPEDIVGIRRYLSSAIQDIPRIEQGEIVCKDGKPVSIGSDFRRHVNGQQPLICVRDSKETVWQAAGLALGLIKLTGRALRKYEDPLVLNR